MKQFVTLVVLFCISANLFSQNNHPESDNSYTGDFSQTILTGEAEKRNSITIGILQGGGSIVGADFEFLVSNHVGLQIGGGFIGFGGGINYHFKPSIRSSFLSLQYWNQGVGDSFAQNAIGPTYVFRGKKWFTFQIGLGATLEKGPAAPDDFEQPPVILLYSIGGYIPI
ncbi:MAG: hypothetical protein ABFS10_05500 [Bacteroidota bacterium]